MDYLAIGILVLALVGLGVTWKGFYSAVKAGWAKLVSYFHKA